LGVIVIIVIIVLPNKPQIPPKIQQQLTFTLMLPESGQFKIDHSSIKYDDQLKVLSFTVAAFGKQVIVSEQPTPDSFTDVPAVYQKVLDGMNDYEDFDVNIGSIHLTVPPQLNGKQAAVLNTKGTLTFVKPSSALSNDQWRQFFTSFTVLQ
jgi:hypothetical protein